MARRTPVSSCAGKLLKSTVLLQAQYVTSKHGCKIGTFLDLGSMDNYVKYRYAKKHKLKSEDIDLQIETIGGQKSHILSKLYTVPSIVWCQVRNLKWYGMEEICSLACPTKATFTAMCIKFWVQQK